MQSNVFNLSSGNVGSNVLPSFIVIFMSGSNEDMTSEISC